MQKSDDLVVNLRLSLPLVLAFAASTLISCGDDEGEVIPKSDLAKIYAEMFMVDEKLRHCGSRELQRRADTSAVYVAIFEKYGYSKADFLSSQNAYIKDAERYSRILKKSVEILEDELVVLRQEEARERQKIDLVQGINRFRPERIFFLSGVDNKELMSVDSLSFYVDSSGGKWCFDPQKGRDTIYRGAQIIVDSLKNVTF